MATITVTISEEVEEFINEEIAMGVCDTKAAFLRYALARLQEERALSHLQEAEMDIKEGRVSSGDLKVLLKKVI